MKFIPPEDWAPQGIADLEAAAWEALHEPGCASVVAGPGAGKTEFLAQRAVYLLQTGICLSSSRILAISFKKDAAENLKARVNKRCSPALAGRFESVTFDAFTKGIVDRFLTAVPQEWQPTKPYDIAFPTKIEVEQFLNSLRGKADGGFQAAIASLDASNFESNHVGVQRLAAGRPTPATATEFAVQRWWEQSLARRPHSSVTFVMLNRLAELLLRTRPHILKSLHLTYPFVFVDEFQDTTYAQYDFLLSAFGGGQTVVTAVGDNKQRIMGWAGALQNAFEQFQSDFHARQISLKANYRSSPNLVKIQQVVARAIDEGAVEAEARTVQQVDGEVAEVWNFPNKATEAEQIASWLAEDMRLRGTAPRDYALLVKQTAERFEEQLAGALGTKNIKLRNESRRIGKVTLQDLLVDELTRVCIAIMKVAATDRAPEAWDIASKAFLRLSGADIDDEVPCQKAEKKLNAFIERLRRYMQKANPCPKYAQVILTHIMEFLDPGALARAYPEYSAGDNLSMIVESLRLHLSASSNGATTWAACIDAFEGKDYVPMMTVHKSKGLEYDTIIFVGLDDQTWWSHSRGNVEGVATFFVALSRAKQRIVFTFCATRGPKKQVEDLYALLREAGVPELEYAAPAGQKE
jgi:superfamily I DNA/RNA helicase